MVTGGAGHCHVTGGELQSQRERERERERESERSRRQIACKSFALDLRARNCGRKLSRQICVTNCLSICVSNRVSAFCFNFAYRFSIVLDFFVFFLHLSCVVLLSCVFIFSFF